MAKRMQSVNRIVTGRRNTQTCRRGVLPAYRLQEGRPVGQEWTQGDLITRAGGEDPTRPEAQHEPHREQVPARTAERPLAEHGVAARADADEATHCREG